jgi:hypothetical protein
LNDDIFEKIKKSMSESYIEIYPDDKNEIEFNNRLFVCFNKNQDNKKLLNKNKTLLKSNREFINRFLEYFGTQNKENNDNNDNASYSSLGTKSTLLPTITTHFEVPAGNTYIQNGIDLNEMLKNNYLTRIKYNLYETYKLNITIDNNWNDIKGQIDWFFNENFIEKVKTITDISTNDLPKYIEEVYNDNDKKKIYNMTKFILDAGDAMHDAYKIPFSLNDSYFQGITFLASQLFGDSSQLTIEELNKCYANTNIEIDGNRYKNVNQGRIHDIRTKAITHLQNVISSTNNKLLLPNIETRLLGQREGYFELIKHIYTIYTSTLN